uniref:NADH-ubiquinone oxidoreductase chain 4 n=1 Tax=Dolichoris vasculosae TaxID=130022 RepID=A0A8A2F6W2_9HYME|nr:NADH dehydrogenase subunit 4 [Dolichoris vasculosae]
MMMSLVMMMVMIKNFHKNLLMNFYANILFLLSFLMFLNYGFNNYWSMIYYWMGLDNISFSLLILSLWITGLMILVKKMNNMNFYILLLLMLLFCLFMSFSSMNYFIFYLFFEITLIPTFILIMGWGYQPERIMASMYMLIYCLFASLPLLLIIYYLYNIFDSLIFEMIFWSNFNNNFIYFFLIFAFLVKLPMFMFHSWLPKAHVEAPISGSMILAGVLLKLGGYGLCRSMMIMMKSSINMNYIYITISLMGMIYLSLVCLQQLDMKILVAYSSVVHMAVMLMSIMSMTYWGYLSGILMMIGHGLCSSAMFIIVNFLYERTNSRNIMINKGMIYFIPSMYLWWFIFCSINMSAPISLNLLSEIIMVWVMLNWSNSVMILLMLGMFISAIYSLYLFSYSFHGKMMSLLIKIYPNNINNYIVMILHWIPLNFLILKMEMFI